MFLVQDTAALEDAKIKAGEIQQPPSKRPGTPLPQG